MNITRENIDTLNAVVKIDIAKADYSENVEKILANYRKTCKDNTLWIKLSSIK